MIVNKSPVHAGLFYVHKRVIYYDNQFISLKFTQPCL